MPLRVILPDQNRAAPVAVVRCFRCTAEHLHRMPAGSAPRRGGCGARYIVELLEPAVAA